MIATALVLLTLAPARVQVGADEFSYALSRQSIKAGPAIVQLVNYGEDEHDLRLRRAGGTRTYRIGKVASGRARRARGPLPAGALHALVLAGRPSQAWHVSDACRETHLTSAPQRR